MRWRTPTPATTGPTQAIYVRGVQTWLETISGTVDATIEGMTVSYNGRSYGVPTGN